MKERNLCHEVGCKSSCCHDVELFLNREINAIFPEATQVTPSSYKRVTKSGVYYYVTAARYRIRIVGDCPNLTNENGCRIYDKKPQYCTRLRIDSENCIKAREHDRSKVGVMS
jgi:hypothetical protein